jgi:hypothetical protein
MDEWPFSIPKKSIKYGYAMPLFRQSLLKRAAHSISIIFESRVIKIRGETKLSIRFGNLLSTFLEDFTELQSNFSGT